MSSNHKYQTSPPPSRAQSPSTPVGTTTVPLSYRSASPLPTPVAHRHDCMTAAAKRYKYLRRLLKFRQMDFEFAAWQMIYLFVSPQKVYRNFQYRKQTKAQFARDDPAFVVLLCFWLCITSAGFALVLKLGVGSFLRFLVYTVCVDTLLMGVLVATILWAVTNHYLVKPTCRDQDVEWGYAFDVHLNAFFPPLIILHFFQLFFYHVFISQDWFISRLFGNLLWVLAIGYYIYITFLGYSALPILKQPRVFLYALPLLVVFFLLSLAFGMNLCGTLMDFYSYRVL
ncbi:protein unc-50 homolog [Penaeus monodon]|uniref:protein unc-50 homolog n=1 Tax=Penaeus monodon TaxID=6687 RepID=UPI0018A7C3BA|nr:protein unc-50 homolog [Penaeus monodon]